MKLSKIDESCVRLSALTCASKRVGFALLKVWLAACLLPHFAVAQITPPRGVKVLANGSSHAVRIYAMRPKTPPITHGTVSMRQQSTTASTSGGPDLQYYGGPVISNVQVVVVYWGNNVSPTATTGIPGFFSAITASNWQDELSEYSTEGVTPLDGGAPGQQSIGRGSLAGVYTIIPSAANSGTTVDDTQVQAELLAQISAGHLPASATDANGLPTTLYMTYFPPGVTITLNGAASCQQFCAYHGTVNLNNRDVGYGVLPDLGPGTACSTGCAGGTELDDLTTVSSHELAEAITDVAVGVAATIAPPLAWYDNLNGEIGDICNASGVPENQAVLPGTSYAVQKIWSNLQQACISAPPTFALSAPASALSGTPINLSLTVQSSTGTPLPSLYTGTVAFTSTDPAAALPASYAFTSADANTHTFSNGATLYASGQQIITVTDTHSGGFVGTAQVTISARTSAYFSFTVPSSATIGAPFSFTVTARNASGSINTGYTGTVHFTSSDPLASLPANMTLSSGVATFTATLRTSGNQTITASDTTTNTITGTSPNILTAGPATHFAVVAPGSAGTGIPFNFTVTALDQSNSTAMNYNGTVHFTSTDAQALLPANTTLINGTGTFNATLRTASNQTITATDTITATIAGTSASIATVVTASHFAVTAPASAIAGNAFNFTVTALDVSNNTVPTYNGTVHFTSTDALATLPADTTLASGAGTFTAILKTVGSQTITAADTVTAITGVSGFVSVATAPPAAAPTFSPYPGTYTTPQTVTMADASPGVTIYYTTDGSTPTTASPKYTGPVTMSTPTTLQAIAAGNGYGASSETFGIYRIVALAPSFSPNPGTYNTPQNVTIADANPGVTIYYTTDGSTPTTASPTYTGPITISTPTTLQAIAAGNGYGASSQAFGMYRIVAFTPTFSPNPGTYSTPQTVTISDSTPGVTIYYTTNGSTPTIASPIYSGPITISTTTSLQAIAAGNGYGASSTAFGTYRIAAAMPTFSPSPGGYSTAVSVTISDSTPGATIYYTTNGTTPTTSSPQYSGPITISSSTTLQAIAASNGFPTSSVAVGTYKIAGAATPTFSPGPGTYSTPQSVAISDASPGVTIYYTTDGSTPTTSSTPYTGPITISTATTLQAIAAGNGYPASSVAVATYKFATAAPAFSPNPGTYTSPQSVTITETTPGATIYYTTNGSTPTTSSPQYTSPILLSSTTTLQAVAVASGAAPSSTSFGIYRIVAATPAFSPFAGTYTTPQMVTITDASPGVTIYYTTDGSTPTTASPQYTGPITISTTTTLQAIAAGNGYGASSDAFAVYRIVALTPTYSPTPGTYVGPQTVTINDASPGVTIYYTTDGSTPTTASPKYTGPITISSKTTLQAIAAGNGYAASSVAFGIYTIN